MSKIESDQKISKLLLNQKSLGAKNLWSGRNTRKLLEFWELEQIIHRINTLLVDWQGDSGIYSENTSIGTPHEHAAALRKNYNVDCERQFTAARDETRDATRDIGGAVVWRQNM